MPVDVDLWYPTMQRVAQEYAAYSYRCQRARHKARRPFRYAPDDLSRAMVDALGRRDEEACKAFAFQMRDAMMED